MSGVTLRELSPELADMVKNGVGTGGGSSNVENVVVTANAHISDDEPKESEGQQTPLIWFDIVD